QVDRMDSLIDEGRASVERMGSSPRRIRVIFRRAIPLDAGVGQYWRPKSAAIGQLFDSLDAGFQTVLENDSKFDACFLRLFDQCAGGTCFDVDRLSHKHV